MANRLLFLDFDGPLLDVSWRYHWLHTELVTRYGGAPLTRTEYWELKRRRLPEREILARVGLGEEAAARLDLERLERVETEPYLRVDRPWPWTKAVLGHLGATCTLVLVTARTWPDRLRRQLDWLGLTDLLPHVVAGRGDGTETAKRGMILEAGYEPTPDSVMVGDTEGDLLTARELGIRAVAVRTGIRDDAHLLACAPDVLLDDVRAVGPWLSGSGWTIPPQPWSGD